MSHPYTLLFRRFLGWVRRSFSFLWLVVVAGYLCVQAGRAVYSNYQSQQQLVALQAQIAQDRQEEDQLNSLLVYYQTDDFKEKELRKDLLLVRPGETVYALPESSVGKELAAEAAQKTLQEEQKVSTLPIWRQWVNYLWYGEK